LNFQNLTFLRILVVFCVRVQNLVQIGLSAAELWPKPILSKTASLRHIEFLKFLVFVQITVYFWSDFAVESKHTDAVAVKDKTRAWQQIAAEFNDVSAAKRSAQQVKR